MSEPKPRVPGDTLPATAAKTTIHPEWPSVTSLAGVFNKSKQRDPDQSVRKFRTFGSGEPSPKASAAEAPIPPLIPTVEENTLEKAIKNQIIVSTSRKNSRDQEYNQNFHNTTTGISRRASNENAVSKRLSIGRNSLPKIISNNSAELQMPSKFEESSLLENRRGSVAAAVAAASSVNTASKTNNNESIAPEIQNDRLAVVSDLDLETNRRGSVAAMVEAQNKMFSGTSKVNPEDSTSKIQDRPVPKSRSDRMLAAKNNEITTAAMKVANAYGKNSEQLQPAVRTTDPGAPESKITELPIPKSRKANVEVEKSVPPGDSSKISTNKVNQNASEKSDSVALIHPQNNETQTRQNRTNENRLGTYSKDKILPSLPIAITKPFASVQPNEPVPTREIKISEIVEKWPPASPPSDSEMNNNNRLDPSKNRQIHDENIKVMPADMNNNNNITSKINSIFSENSKTNAKTSRENHDAEKMDKFASVLVIGLTGSGKTTMIEELLDQQFKKTGKGDIVEHTLQVQVPGSNDNFYNLRVIDAPGFKNEKSGNTFARMFATLLQYCRSRDGFRGKAPSLVLFVVPFDEKFLENENCDMINFLKVIHHFESYFKNPKFPNFIFVLTHLANAPRRDQLYPQSRIHEFVDLIKKYTTLTGPTTVICAENQGEAAGLQVEDGFYKLPNGETYPRNLIDEMKILLTRKGHISLTETIIRTAFGSEYPNCIQLSGSKCIPLLKEDSPAIPQMKQTLKEIYSQIKIENTEISSLLQIGWLNVQPDLQKTFATSLLAAQRTFQIRKISNFADLPTETESLQTFKLLRELPQNAAVADLLIHTLQLKIPYNSQTSFIGEGYDLSQDRGTNMSPLQFCNILKTSPIGQIPNELQCHVTEDRALVFKFFYSAEDYGLDRMKELGIRNACFPGNLPIPTLQRPGYNVIKENQEPTKTTVATALIEYRAFRLTLQETDAFEFKSVFWEALQSQPQLESKNLETVQAWKEFFGCWGTHLVKSAYGGGSVEINFRGKILSKVFSSLKQADTIPSDDDMANRVFQWVTGDGLDFAAVSNSDNKADFLKGLDVQTTLQGGDDKFRDTDFMKFSYDQVSEMRDEWKESLFLYPVMLQTNLVLVPISYFVRQKCEVTALKMDIAFHFIYSQYISASEVKQSSCAIL